MLCAEKQSYSSHEEACAHVTRHALFSYLCPSCGYIHLTHHRTRPRGVRAPLRPVIPARQHAATSAFAGKLQNAMAKQY